MVYDTPFLSESYFNRSVCLYIIGSLHVYTSIHTHVYVFVRKCVCLHVKCLNMGHKTVELPQGRQFGNSVTLSLDVLSK